MAVYKEWPTLRKECPKELWVEILEFPIWPCHWRRTCFKGRTNYNSKVFSQRSPRRSSSAPPMRNQVRSHCTRIHLLAKDHEWRQNYCSILRHLRTTSASATKATTFTARPTSQPIAEVSNRLVWAQQQEVPDDYRLLFTISNSSTTTSHPSRDRYWVVWKNNRSSQVSSSGRNAVKLESNCCFLLFRHPAAIATRAVIQQEA